MARAAAGSTTGAMEISGGALRNEAEARQGGGKREAHQLSADLHQRARHIFRYVQRTSTHRFPAGLGLAAIIFAVSTALLFYWTFGRMWGRWSNAHGYYSHGPLVIPIALVSAWLIIRRRGLPMHSTRRGRGLGMIILSGALLLHLASMYALVTFVSGFMIPVVAAAFVLYLGGWPMLRRLWFPIVFLAFMVPLPDLTISDVNFRLKMMAAQAATMIVNGLGVPAYLKGAEIFLAGRGGAAVKHLTVEDACSGLKSLISLLAFATLFAYACRLRGYKRALLWSAAIPIAVAANVVRIAVLSLVANRWSVSLATPGGWVHDGMGFAVFVIAFTLMFLLEGLLELLPGRAQSPAAVPP